jgi:hypothetical protein
MTGQSEDGNTQQESERAYHLVSLQWDGQEVLSTRTTGQRPSNQEELIHYLECLAKMLRMCSVPVISADLDHPDQSVLNN